jgi:hypothetical protein
MHVPRSRKAGRGRAAYGDPGAPTARRHSGTDQGSAPAFLFVLLSSFNTLRRLYLSTRIFISEYRVVARLRFVLRLHALRVRACVRGRRREALNFQPEGLANACAEGWWPQRGDVFPGPAGLQKAR